MEVKKEDVLAALVTARLVLDTGGWRQGHYGEWSSVETPHCAIGCIEAAVYSLDGLSEAYHIGRQAKLQLASVTKYGVVNFNDTLGRTKEEIEQLFEKAIAALEAELEAGNR